MARPADLSEVVHSSSDPSCCVRSFTVAWLHDWVNLMLHGKGYMAKDCLCDSCLWNLKTQSLPQKCFCPEEQTKKEKEKIYISHCWIVKGLLKIDNVSELRGGKKQKENSLFVVVAVSAIVSTL